MQLLQLQLEMRPERETEMDQKGLLPSQLLGSEASSEPAVQA